jgi:hypothetical protein
MACNTFAAYNRRKIRGRLFPGDERQSMRKPIGFVLTIHNRLDQAARLIGKLNQMFDHPPIVCHCDFSQTKGFIQDCPKNVTLVQPHVATSWGEFSIVDAALRAVRLLYASKESPDWFVYLSGADYPIKSAARILSDLQNGAFDAYIKHELISHNSCTGTWQRHCHQRYCRLFDLVLPIIGRGHRGELRPKWKRYYFVEHPFLTRPFLPFSDNLRCYAGESWFSANRRAANYILDFHDRNQSFTRHYRGVQCADESYFNTILANASGLHLKNDCLRYTDWSTGGNHPKTLKMEDLRRLAESPAHFARKFDPTLDAGILDALDARTVG